LWLSPGLYSIDFHLLPSGRHEGKDVISSERYPLDVNGVAAPLGHAYGLPPLLNPEVSWSTSCVRADANVATMSCAE
jgi:hypothetical protein